MRITIRFGITFALLLPLISIAAAAAFATPSKGAPWSSVFSGDRIYKELIWSVISAALSIVLDLLIFILPIPVILRLNLSTGKKVQLLAVFTTALV